MNICCWWVGAPGTENFICHHPNFSFIQLYLLVKKFSFEVQPRLKFRVVIAHLRRFKSRLRNWHFLLAGWRYLNNLLLLLDLRRLFKLGHHLVQSSRLIIHFIDVPEVIRVVVSTGTSEAWLSPPVFIIEGRWLGSLQLIPGYSGSALLLCMINAFYNPFRVQLNLVLQLRSVNLTLDQ
jgi:hypothetical protein